MQGQAPESCQRAFQFMQIPRILTMFFMIAVLMNGAPLARVIGVIRALAWVGYAVGIGLARDWDEALAGLLDPTGITAWRVFTHFWSLLPRWQPI